MINRATAIQTDPTATEASRHASSECIPRQQCVLPIETSPCASALRGRDPVVFDGAESRMIAVAGAIEQCISRVRAAIFHDMREWKRGIITLQADAAGIQDAGPILEPYKARHHGSDRT